MKRRLLFSLLYFSEGAPIGYAWWSLPSQLRAGGIPVDTIALLASLLALPWAFKVAWAPLLDHWRSPRWGYRSWIMFAQAGMGLALIPLIFIDAVTAMPLVFVCLIMHALFAATQDVAIDALCIGVIAPDERGRVNGWMQAGMLAGRSLFGGGTLILFSAWGPGTGLIALIIVLWSVALVVWRSDTLKEGEPPPPAGGTVAAYRETVYTLVRDGVFRAGLAFALIAGAAYEGFGSVAGPFLIDRGFSTAETGTLFALPVVLAMAAGAVLGGVMSDRTGPRTMTLWSLLAVVVSAWAIAGADIGRVEDRVLLLVALLAVYFSIGLFTASSYAMFMNATQSRFRATQFSAFMGGTNLCESWSAAAAGRLIPATGYGPAFAILALLSLGSIPLLARIGPHQPAPAADGTSRNEEPPPRSRVRER